MQIIKQQLILPILCKMWCKWKIVLILTVLYLSLSSNFAIADTNTMFEDERWYKTSNYPNLIAANYVFLIDQDSKEVILERNADVMIAPSSMTKLMTAYVVFDQLKQGDIALNSRCLVGKEAWRKSGSTMFLNYGDVVTVGQLLAGLLVVSGNDAAIALAEVFSGDYESFANLMNQTAKKIGLKNSNFKNPHGLNEEGHYTTLRDLAILSIRIADDFPEYMHYFSTPKFTYRKITQANRNPLLVKGYKGITGMKTGYTSKGGYGMVASVNRDGRRLIAIINGAKTSKQREGIVTDILDYGFDNYKKIILFNKNHTISKTKVWFGNKDQLEVISDQDIFITLPKNKSINDLKIEIKYKEELIYAPVNKEKEIAILTVKFAGKIIRESSLFAKENIDKASSFVKIWEMAKYKGYKFFTEFF